VPCRNPTFANRINENAKSWLIHIPAYTPGQVHPFGQVFSGFFFRHDSDNLAAWQKLRL
jgi:hypothetical protein